MSTTDRLVAALAARNPETTRLVERAVRRLAADLDADAFDQIIAAVEHPTGVSTLELTELAGITKKQADHWTAEGYLTAQTTGPGSGHPRRYLSDQVFKATEMGKMTKSLGVDPVHASYAVDRRMTGQRARAGDLEIIRRAR